jgi:CubicO group peptidase (beta-lactamase class C family)
MKCLRGSTLVLFLMTITCFRAGDVWAEEAVADLFRRDPGKSLSLSFPPAEGWSAEKLALAMLYAREAGASAVVVLHNGHLVLEWGMTDLRMLSHSVRKSLLSALYGIAVERGLIDLSATLAELGINDRPPCLTADEKTATVKDLLKARSGVYHPAAAESQKMKKNRPVRGAFTPGEHWYYNNWDFNVLGTIFERKTNMDIGRAFHEWIAQPVGMQDFRPRDVHYHWEAVSLHPSYPFWISARDLARFGQLFLQQGRWNGLQVVPARWVAESTTAWSQTEEEGEGYGYMWWTHGSGAYYAAGYMGQMVLVMPQHDVVIVTRVFTGTPALRGLSGKAHRELNALVNPLEGEEFREMAHRILAASPHAGWGQENER